MPRHEEWLVDIANSELRFTVSHLVIAKISGRFTRWEATVHLDPIDVRCSSVEVVIDAASIDTGNAERDAHLRSPDFLNTTRHPQIRFTSREVVPAGQGDYLMSGELTLLGRSLPMTLFVSDEGRIRDAAGRARAAFTAHGGFNRRDFGMLEDRRLGAGKLIVGELVDVQIEAEAVLA
jgi:polyisoprenoid-binding protein YceI